MVGEGVEEQLDQCGPVAGEPSAFDGQERHLHQGVGVGVHRGGEEGLLAGKVGVHGGGRHAHVAGDVREGDASEAVGREAPDGGPQERLAGPLALGGDAGVEGVRSHRSEGLTVSVNS